MCWVLCMYVCVSWFSHYSSFRVTNISSLRAACHHFFLLLTPVACMALCSAPTSLTFHLVPQVLGSLPLLLLIWRHCSKHRVVGLSLQDMPPNLDNSLFCRKSIKTAIHPMVSIILVQLLKHFLNILLFGVMGSSYCLRRLIHLFCFSISFHWVWLQKKNKNKKQTYLVQIVVPCYPRLKS